MMAVILSNLTELVTGVCWTLVVAWTSYKIGRWQGRRSK